MENATFSRRGLLGLASAAGSIGLLGACSGGGQDSDPGSPSKEPITVADWSNSNTAVVDAAAAYTKETGIKVSFQAPVSYDDYTTRFRTVLSGKNPPDVVRCDDDFVAQFAAEGALADLTPMIKAQHFDAGTVTADLYDFTKSKDGQYALAIAIQPRLIYYNKTLFEKKGVPLPPGQWTDKGWKWSDFLAAATKITDPAKKVWGCMILNDVGFEQTFSWNNGGEGTFSKDGKRFTLADQQGIEAMQWLGDLTNKYKVQPSWGAIQQTNSGESMFVSQKLGMYFAGSGSVPYFQENADGFEWDIAPVPGQARQNTAGAMIVYAIPAKSTKQAEAFQFLSYLVGDQAGKLYVKENAFVPSNKAAAATVTGTTGKSPEHYGMLPDAVAANHARNSTPATAEAAATYQPPMQQIWTGEKTAQEVLTAVRGKVEDVLKAAP
ncbi:ABC transporter substrate-binding protein [Microlunatus soli]|uniref:ABC-type glycerol-3-phosphate transport system, substrate-binding protein n=1 Tax=Microlunatus soli TaxID=630515 RepID=A0A1H1RUN0_9ACTN|nr:sugar ABC transporter substrate-binding protein [Microlunatus soli]SDS39422.1 ABC-type glycerol-3-phosphate transport system, substrate-binding protein [Microlunatus soli]